MAALMNKSVQNNHGRQKEKGQSLVEFALFFSIILMMLSLVLDMGRLYFAYLAIQNAAAEGAAYGIVFPTWHDGTDNPNPNNIAYRALHEAPGGLIKWDNPDVETEVLFTTPGNPIKVTVYSDFKLITPIAQLFAGGEVIRIKGTAVQNIISPGA